jgi:hypothetical protein
MFFKFKKFAPKTKLMFVVIKKPSLALDLTPKKKQGFLNENWLVWNFENW